MQRYIIKGFTGPNADFTDEIELPDNFDFDAAMASTDVRYNAAWNVLKRALLETDCDSDYLETLDSGCFEVREDLADDAAQVVLCGEALGCDNCQDPDGDGGCGDNEWREGCDDGPHGGMLLTFDPA